MQRWRSKILSGLFVTAAIALGGCGRGSTPGPPGLDSPEQLTLYSIDGRDIDPDQKPKTDEEFHGFPVLGKVEMTDADKRKEIVDALKEGLALSDGKAAACFWPRHAIRTVERGRTTDYVICFECSQLRIFDADSILKKTVSRDPVALFNKHLKEAGISLAPSPFGDGK